MILSPELRNPIPWALTQDLDVKAILEVILEVIEKYVLQSNQHFCLHSGVTMCVRNPQGGKGGATHKLIDIEEFC